MAVDLYPLTAVDAGGQPAFGGANVKLSTSGTEAWIANAPGSVVARLSGVWATRLHGQWVLADVATSEVLYTFSEGAGCGCSDPLKAWDPRPLPVVE